MAYLKNRKPLVAEILKQDRWFSDLPKSLQADFMNFSNIAELGQGQSLLAVGDTELRLYCVLSGCLGVSSFPENGKEVLVTMLEPVSWGGELSLFERAPRTHSIYAIKPSLVLQIEPGYLDKVLNSEPIIWKHLGQLLNQKLRVALELGEMLSSSPGPARLAMRLLWISSNNGLWTNKNKRILDVQQEELASMTSLTRTTVNQILQKFQKEGAVLLHYGKIEIISPSILKHFALSKSA